LHQTRETMISAFDTGNKMKSTAWVVILVPVFLLLNLAFSYFCIKHTPAGEAEQSYFYLFMSGVFYFISIITFVQFLFFSEATYAYYVLYVLVNLCYFTFMYSSMPQLSDNFQQWFSLLRYHLSLPLLCVSYLLYVLFAIGFLGLKRGDSLVYQWLRRFVKVYAFIFIVSLLLIVTPPNNSAGNIVRTILLISCMPMGIVSILLVYFRIKNNIARILCIGSLCFFAGSVLGFLFSSGLLPYPSFTPPFDQWVFYTESGTLLEVVLFSSSFAYRNKVLAEEEHKAKEEVQLEIEKNKEKEKRLQLIRDEIARDLHDDIGASLSNINILTELARRNATNPDKAGEYLSKAAEDIQDISESLSDIVWNINPKYDNPDHLFVRMRRYAADMMDGKSIEYELQFPENATGIVIDMDKRRDFYLIFKEAVNNMIKYSGAANARVKLEFVNKLLQLTVQDNGKGFDVQQAINGNGLTNMRKRAVEIGAEFSINSVPGKGTHIKLTLPIT
jgi:signal transduction histidine kinase